MHQQNSKYTINERKENIRIEKKGKIDNKIQNPVRDFWKLEMLEERSKIECIVTY